MSDHMSEILYAVPVRRHRRRSVLTALGRLALVFVLVLLSIIGFLLFGGWLHNALSF